MSTILLRISCQIFRNSTQFENMEQGVFSLTPPELREIANNTLNQLLPEKSRKVYEKDYETFTIWCNSKAVGKITENVLIAYFEEQSKTKKSSTLWSLYSKLRACINIYQKTEIKNYARLQAFLKRQSDGYKPKKSVILDLEGINKFTTQAQNSIYLGLKVGK